MQNFKSLMVWQNAHAFTLNIYRLTKIFPKEEIYGLTSQLRRASSSIPANIAEGCGKSSKLDFARILEISLGSANETDYFMLLAKDLNYLNQEDYGKAENQINKIKAMLINLIQQVRK
jgi:four helix bundle protein